LKLFIFKLMRFFLRFCLENLSQASKVPTYGVGSIS
jgi:hypothetical protein